MKNASPFVPHLVVVILSSSGHCLIQTWTTEMYGISIRMEISTNEVQEYTALESLLVFMVFQKRVPLLMIMNRKSSI